MKVEKPSDELLSEVFRLRSLAAGYWTSWCLQAAVQLDLFTLLEKEALRAEEVAARLNLEPALLTSLLKVLKMENIVASDDEGRFFNTDVASAALVKGAPLDQTGSIQHNQAAQILGPSFPKIFHPGFTLPASEGVHESPKDLFLAATSVASLKASIVLPYLELGKKERILDLGAGSGGYTFLMAQEHPDLTGTLIERGAMAEGSQSMALELGLRDRIEVIDEDFLTANPGEDYTLALVSHIVHFVPFETSKKLFHRAFDSLLPNGRIFVHDLLRERPDQPMKEPELLNLNVYLRQGIGVPTCDEVVEWLLEAGFTDPKIINMPIGPNTLISARKP